MRVWIDITLLNFFLPGTGYLVLGVKKLLSIFFIAGLVGLTYVEFGIQTPLPDLYTIMFVSVLVMNTGFAIDAYQLGKAAEA